MILNEKIKKKYVNNKHTHSFVINNKLNKNYLNLLKK